MGVLTIRLTSHGTGTQISASYDLHGALLKAVLYSVSIMFHARIGLPVLHMPENPLHVLQHTAFDYYHDHIITRSLQHAIAICVGRRCRSRMGMDGGV